MMLAWLIAIPVLGGFLAWLCERLHADAPRYCALAALAADAALALTVASQGAGEAWLAGLRLPWIPQLGIAFRLDMDGLSLVLVLLTLGLGIIGVVTSWSEIRERVGLFHLNLLLTLAGVVGVFLALDLFLFFFFWELMLVPMSLVIALWGHERRIYAAIKFFIFTIAGSLLMLIAIIYLSFAYYHATGLPSFAITDMYRLSLPLNVQVWLFAAFALAFAIKVPLFPLHTWLPDAHVEAPTGGSIILAGVLLKLGTYGFLRFVLPFFPEATAKHAWLFATLSVIGII